MTPILSRLDKFAELLSQDLPREIIIERMGWDNPSAFRAALSRLRAKLGTQAV